MSPRTLASSVVCRTRAPTQKSQRVTNRATIAPAASTAASLSQIPPLARGFGAAMTPLSATRLSAAGLSAAGLMSDPGCASTMPFRSLSTDRPCALHAGRIEEIDGIVALAAIGIIRRRDRRPSLRPLEEGAEIVDVAAPRQSRVARRALRFCPTPRLHHRCPPAKAVVWGRIGRSNSYYVPRNY